MKLIAGLIAALQLGAKAQVGSQDSPDDMCVGKSIDWHQLQNEDEVGAAAHDAQVPNHSLTTTFDEEKMSLTFEIPVEYLGNSSDGNFDNRAVLGTTYVMDFESFETSTRGIDSPGSCQNRVAAPFLNGGFNEWWGYMNAPAGDVIDFPLGSTWLAYPPMPSEWSYDAVTAVNNDGSGQCMVNYASTFTWQDLLGCQDADSNTLLTVTDSVDALTLSGTMYINVVSPYAMGATDSGFYRSWPLAQSDFSIVILKQVNVLASTGVELFISSIIGVYEDVLDKSFQISILTQSADYIALGNASVLSSPFGSTATSVSEVTSSCLVSSSFTCGQIFTLTIDASGITCDPLTGSDFTGSYDLGFAVQCRDITDLACGYFLEDNNGAAISLGVSATFVDRTCGDGDNQMYETSFDGALRFYDADDFLTEKTGDYVIGQDSVYVEVAVDLPTAGGFADTYAIDNLYLKNVFVCTAADGANLDDNLDEVSGQGGCLSGNIDDDGPYNMFTNEVPNVQYFAQMESGGGDNAVRFSFLQFDVARTTMFVHVVVLMDLVDANGRRRLEEYSNEFQVGGGGETEVAVNQYRHFITTTGVAAPAETNGDVTAPGDLEVDEMDDEEALEDAAAELAFVSGLAVMAMLSVLAQ